MQAQPLSIVRRSGASAPTNASPAAPTPAASGGLSIVKRGGQPVQADFKTHTVADEDGDGVLDLARGAWDFVTGTAQGLNPLPALDALGRAAIPDAVNQAFGGQAGATGPMNFLQHAWKAQNAVLERARASYAEGDLGNATLHFTNWLVPLVGPAVDDAQSDPSTSAAKKAGKVTGILSSLFAPKGVANAVGGRRVPGLGMKNPDLPADALQFARDNAVPLDAATATGSKAVKNLKALADNSLSEAVTHRGQTFRAGQDAALERVGGELLGRARPADWTPERAGQHLRTRVEGAISGSRAEQGHAYKTLRDLEADPANITTVVDKPEMRSKTTSDGRSALLEPAVTRDVALATDLAPAKAGVKAWFDQLSKRKDSVGLSGPETKVHQALYKLLELEDVVPLSAVDEVLSGFKTIAREVPAAGRAEAGALKAVDALSRQVDAAARAVPGASKALAEGRAATRAKYRALEVLDELKVEPVRAFRDLMSAGDASLSKLRAVQKFVTPADMATLGRAWLQSQVDAVGGQKQGWAKAKAEWNRVGTETRKIVFGKDASLPRDIDHFFRVAAEIEKNPNPSGSALTLWSGGQGVLLLTEPMTGVKSLLATETLSRLLYSPSGVRLLTRGLTTPRGNKVASAAIAAKIATAAERAGARLTPVPAATEERGRRQ